MQPQNSKGKNGQLTFEHAKNPDRVCNTKMILLSNNKMFLFFMVVLHRTSLVWTGFKIALRHKLLTHYKTRLHTAYKKGNSIYYCFGFDKKHRS